MGRLVVALAVAVLVAACGPGATTATGDPQTDAKANLADAVEIAGTQDRLPGAGLTVVATVFPLAWIAEQVAPGADVAFLGARGQDPHDLELSPSDRTLVETADVVVYMGDIGFQPQVERAVQSSRGLVVAVAAVTGEEVLRAHADDHENDAHADSDDHTHDDSDAHDDDDSDAHDDDDSDDRAHDDDRAHADEGDADPHLWFDAALMADVAAEIGVALATVDPADGEAYEAAARSVHHDLVALDRELDALLDGCRFDTAIVSHEAYGYLLEPRGLAQEGISGAGGHSDASPQRLAELSERIRDEGIPAVLVEPFEGRADAEALARTAGVPLVEIDPLEVATDEQRQVGYLRLLREQAEAFAAALDCAGAK